MPDINSIPRPRTATDLKIPLMSYFPTLQQEETIGRAQAALVRKCLRQFGLTTEIQFIGDPAPSTETRTNGSLGWLDPIIAARYGYHAPESAADKRSVELAKQSFDLPKGDAYDVATGRITVFAGMPVPKGGCVQKAADEIAAGTGQPLVRTGDGLIAQQLWITSFARMESDKRVQAATKLWSERMAAQGYKYATPEDAAGDNRWGEGASPSGQGDYAGEEIKTATADANCRIAVNYSGIRMGVLAAYQNKLINDNVTQLRAYKAAVDEQAKKAAQILAASGS